MTEHKTSGAHQALHIGLSKQLHKYIALYVENIRKKLPCFALADGEEKQENLFVTYSGKALTAGDLANAITLELATAGYQHRANCTKFRKMTVSLVLYNYYLFWNLTIICDFSGNNVLKDMCFRYVDCWMRKDQHWPNL